jgi:protein kinase A
MTSSPPPSTSFPPSVSPKSASPAVMPPSSKPKASKFSFDPLSMLLPHERAARAPATTRQSASASQSASTSLVAKAQQTRQSMHSAPHQQQFPISPPPSQVMTTPPMDWSTSSAAAMDGVEELHPDESVSVAGGHTRPIGLGIQPPRAPTTRRARLEDWEIVETLGTGTFGRVLLVRQRPSYRPTSYHPIFPHLFKSQDPSLPSPAATAHADNQLPHFAMKVLRKTEIVRLKQVEHINSERAILERIRHPFIVEL